MADGNVSLNVSWDIKNLNSYCWPENDYRTPIFNSSSNNWFLNLKTFRNGNNDTITVYLARTKSDPPLSLKCSLELASSISQGTHRQLELRESLYFYSKTLVKDKGKFDQWKESVLINDVLTVRFRLWSRDEPLKMTHSISTVIGCERLSFDWVVPDFAGLPPNKKACKSVPSRPSLSLALLYVEDIVKLEASLEGNKEKTYVKFEVAVASAAKTFRRVAEHTFPQASIQQVAVLFPDFIARSTLLAPGNHCLPGGALTLRCICILSSGIKSQQVTHHQKSSTGQTLSEKSAASSSTSSSSLQSDMRKMYEDRICTDFEIRLANGEGFPVHKNIVFSRAPSFKDLFGTNLKSVALPDLWADTLRRLLLFLYTDEVDDMDYSSALKLYLVADKYLLHSLKQKCLDLMKVAPTVSKILGLNISTPDEELRALTFSHLKRELNETTACIILSSATDPRLVALAKDYVHDNDVKVVTSRPWSILMKRKPEVAAETLKDLYIKRYKVENVKIKTEPKEGQSDVQNEGLIICE